MNRLTALLIATVLWAGIFLPGLGSEEFKGEEGRRVMPAVTMANGGSWVVPEVGGEQFLRKPPLVQWCIAGSIKLFGHNAWAVRLPSVLSVLVLAAVIIFATRGWLITEQSLLAAVLMMTQVSVVLKCRMAELEAVYFALSGIAIVLWMSWWERGRSPWLVWTVPFVFNGLALLAKAPMHLLFFYAVALAAMAASGELRRHWHWRLPAGWGLVAAGAWLWFFQRQPWALALIAAGGLLLPRASRPHFVGVAIMLAIFAAWWEPYYRQVDPDQLKHTLKRQMGGRILDADLKKWLLNLPSGLGDHLPWVLFVPLLWHAASTPGLHERGAALLRGGRWAVAGSFVGVLLVPGMLPRYVLPLAVPFSLLLVQVLWECPRRFRHWWRYTVFGLTFLTFIGAVAAPFLMASASAQGLPVLHAGLAVASILPVFCGALLLMGLRRRLHESLHLTLWTALVVVMAMTLYAICVLPFVRKEDNLRKFAQQIDEFVPADKPLIAYSVGDYSALLGVLFYLEHPFTYAPEDKAAPYGERYYVLRGKDREKFENKFRLVGEPLAVMEAREDERKDGPSILVKAERKR